MSEDKTFDMQSCKPGDLLLCESGCVVKYVGYGEHPRYRSTPYKIEYFNGEEGTRSIKGLVDTGLFGSMTKPFNIVGKALAEICHVKDRSMLPKPSFCKKCSLKKEIS